MRWKLPARWYRFAQRTPDGSDGGDFIVIDTSSMLSRLLRGRRGESEGGRPEKHNVPVQLALANAGLAASKADWNIVIGHHPVYSGKFAKGEQPAGEVRRRAGRRN